MNGKKPALMIFLIAAAGVLFAQSSSTTGMTFENQYLKITILPGWVVGSSVAPRFNLIHDRYVLSINPIFIHASGITGGRLGEITSGMPSVEAVRANVEGPWGSDCAQTEEMIITGTLNLDNLYTDESKADDGCEFPSDDQPAWFGSYFVSEGSESEYTITLAYDTAAVNALPKKGSPELRQVLSDVVTMLKTLNLKPPIVISSVVPQSAPSGATVTLHGSGFDLRGYNLALSFRDFPNNPMPLPKVAADGKSLTFEVPTSRSTISCKQPGYIDVGKNCVPVPAHHVDINDCPLVNNRATNFCGTPFPPATYQIWITGEGVHSNEVPLIVTEPKPTPVSISLMYPNYGVLAGDMITVRGRGFTPTGNTVKIGSAVINSIPSLDGKTITFQAPPPTGTSFLPGIRIYKSSVSNANGDSNSIFFDYL